MTCYYPLSGWRSKKINPATGKRGVVFRRDDGYEDMPITIACGRCIGCRLDKSREWAIRCVHEAKQYEANSFITLTYKPEKLPEFGSLEKRDFQLFMKRLRKSEQRKPGNEIKYFMCGEYGSRTNRPHYHACFFNYRPTDLVLYKVKDGIPLYLSETLASHWQQGFVTVGNVTFESAAYIARYTTKKLNGEEEEKIGKDGFRPYERLDPETGEVRRVTKEYSAASNGIGRAHAKKYKEQHLNNDGVHTGKGRFQKIPKYYDNIYEHDDPDRMARIKVKRREKAEASKDNTTDRLRARETVKRAQIKSLKRQM